MYHEGHHTSSQEQENDATLDATRFIDANKHQSLRPYPPVKESVDGMLILATTTTTAMKPEKTAFQEENEVWCAQGVEWLVSELEVWCSKVRQRSSCCHARLVNL